MKIAFSVKCGFTIWLCYCESIPAVVVKIVESALNVVSYLV